MFKYLHTDLALYIFCFLVLVVRAYRKAILTWLKSIPNSVSNTSIGIILIAFASVFISRKIGKIPDPGFLSDIAAFEGVLISIAIPLSFEMIARISERYQSDIISKKFAELWEIKLLPKFLIVNIISAISFRFYFDGTDISNWWKFWAWFSLIVFIIIAFVLFRFIQRLKQYTTDENLLIEELFKDAERLLK